MSENTLPTYQFDGYTFRAATYLDLALARTWNEADPEHGWEMQYPQYWIEQSRQVNSYVLEDGEGIVFFVKSIRQPHNEIEITMQFDRSMKTVMLSRVVFGLMTGFAWLKKALPANRYDAVYFVSENPELIAFAQNNLGFVANKNRYVFDLRSSEVRDGERIHSKSYRQDEEKGNVGQVRQSH